MTRCGCCMQGENGAFSEGCLEAEIERWKYHEGLAIERCNELEAQIERLLTLLQAIERHTAPGTRTWDTCLRDMGLANDLARAALESKP